MGPTIVVDKSTIQSLSRDAVFVLSDFFYTVITPVLVIEILADLKKDKGNRRKAEQTVSNLASKVQPIDGFVNVHFESLCVRELLGTPVPMDRRPVVSTRRITTDDGTSAAMVDSPEEDALFRWSCGSFNETEERLALRWRASTAAVDLEALTANAQPALRSVPRFKSIEELKEGIDQYMASAGIQLELLSFFLSQLPAARSVPALKAWTLQRWRSGEYEMLKDFAPYVAHCIRVNLVFYLGLLHGLIGTRRTNRIDMEYFYYTPFGHIFSSGDNLHRDIAPILLDDDQSFIGRDDLVSELNSLAAIREAKADAAENEEPYPPDTSIVRQLTIKHLGAWIPPVGLQMQAGEDTQEAPEVPEEILKILDAMSQEKDRRPRRRWPT
ncbi:hypothetical protein LCGC14_0016370 [marine sediment metagenome]|uniref:PIN domain-containing protein n=1 Tax=marine sediment metagenome TaxID=412755 RepID=A0A0F9W1G9_9ZZZZ|nr:hypothetical protein [Phycisphaerae bacterium]